MFATSLPAIRAVPAYLVAVVAGVALLIYLDVQFSVATRDPLAPPANMHPQIWYLFVPFFSLIVLVFAAVVDPILRKVFGLASLKKMWQYTALGFAYSTLVATLTLMRVGTWGLVAGPALAISLAVIVRRQAGRHES